MAKRKAAVQRVAVTERALVQRINRKFVSLDGRPAREVKKTRGARAVATLGDFYVLNTRENFIEEHHMDIEEMGRELKVLADYECLAEEGN